MLAKAVQDERRRSAGEIVFYARNRSSYSGEFTTAVRHFFVLEPPLSPEPDPDMDAIRQALEHKPDVLTALSEREAGAALVTGRALDEKPNRAERAAALPSALTVTETATGAKRLLYFNDHRPPHEVQSALQQAIVAAMKRGARFTTSSKEGETNIRWDGSRFVRIDRGDYPDTVIYASEVDFLDRLRKYFDWETSKNVYPEKVSELVAWRLMLRLLRD